MLEFYKQMALKACDGIMFADDKGIIQFWNDGCVEIFGFEEKEAVGKNLDIIIHEKHRSRHWEGFYNVISTGKGKYEKKMLSVPAIHKSGEKIFIEFSVQAIEYEGKVVGFSSIVRLKK